MTHGNRRWKKQSSKKREIELSRVIKSGKIGTGRFVEYSKNPWFSEPAYKATNHKNDGHVRRIDAKTLWRQPSDEIRVAQTPRNI
jgi:hypothetical protein